MTRLFYYILLSFSTHFQGVLVMKKLSLVFLLLLQFVILPQNSFVRQITSGDFDARNPFIYKDEFGSYPPIFFELHKNNFSNIYQVNYNSDEQSFSDTIAITTGNHLDINPAFERELGLIFQTNRNGNWDLAVLPDSNGYWSEIEYIANTNLDEEQPKIIQSIFGFQDSINILFKRDDEIVFTTYGTDNNNEKVLFNDNSEYHYTDFAGILIEYTGSQDGVYAFATKVNSSNSKSIVSKFKLIGGDWQEETTLLDVCDCTNLSSQVLGYSFWSITYEDTLNGNRRIFGMDNWTNPPTISEIPIQQEGNLSSFDLYALLIVGKEKHQKLSDPDLYFPHTYLVENEGITKVRFDPSDIGVWWEDSLLQVSIPNSQLAVGPIGMDPLGIVSYTVWEDSIDGHIQLFGIPQHLAYGSVEDESIASDFILYQNYPNPFNPSTNIEYKLLQASDVKFNVFNVIGEKVFEQNFGYQTAGNYKVNFDGKNLPAGRQGLPSGVYVYSIYTNENRLSRKMMLMK